MVDRTVAVKTAKDFVKECQQQGLHFSKVYLFGSYAKGGVHDGSDIDLLIVSSQFTSNVLENLKLYSRINIKYPIIETHPFSVEDFNSEKEFISHILTRSIEIL